MQIFARPYHLLGITAIILIILSFFVQKETVDSHFHDTVFILANSHVFIILGILLFIPWFIYKLTDKILLSKTLTWIHVLGTVLPFLFFVIYSFFESFSKRGSIEWRGIYFINELITTLFVIATLLQLIFLFNILAGFLKNKRR